jgi:hypothetical protein
MVLLVEHNLFGSNFSGAAYAHQATRETAYAPQTLMGIEHYLHRALAAYDAQARG